MIAVEQVSSPVQRGAPQPWIQDCGLEAAVLNPSREAQIIFEDALRHHVAGRIAHALARYERALFLKPDYAEACNNLAAALVAQGRLDDAVARYKQAIFLKPDYAEAHSNLAVALAAQGKLAEAIGCYERAVALNPGHAGLHYNLAVALTAQGGMDRAVAEYRRAIALKPDYAEAHNNLGNLLAGRNRSNEAIVHYARAIAIDPGHAEAHSNLGNALRDQGQFENAAAHYARAIAIRPDFPEAHYNRAEIKRFHRGDADLAALERLALRRDLPAGKAPFVHFALAKALDDCGDYVRAIEHLRRGNELKRAQIDYDESAVLESLRRIAALFDGSLFERFRGEGDPSPAPVFVLGMPRSGSTLIEQILAGHPGIHAAGERMDLEQALGPSDPYPECIPSLDAASLRRIARSYLSRLPGLADGRIRILNKLPRNFLYIGLIRLILPNAKIVHTVRHPLDTCLSCYSKLFTSGQGFSYDLGELGRYYRGYGELMDHWRSLLPPNALLDVAYEDVVGDLEGQARRLVDYCGLPWDDRCLDFGGGGRFVQTASAVQVRKPLFRSSLERWRAYEFGIGPLLRELGNDESGKLDAATMAAHGSM